MYGPMLGDHVTTLKILGNPQPWILRPLPENTMEPMGGKGCSGKNGLIFGALWGLGLRVF